MNDKRGDPPRVYTGETIVIPRREVLPGTQPPRAPIRPPQRRRIKRALRWGLLSALVLVLIVLVGLYLQVRSVAAQVVVRDARLNAPLWSSPLTGANILIVGVDARDGHPEEGVRSDTLIVAHINAAGRWTNLLSIPRDTLTHIGGIQNKINVAYGQGYEQAETLFGAGTTPQQGGMALAAQTVEALLQLPARGQRIDYVAQVNFDGFAQIIDALGGVTINVPKQIIDDEYPTPDFGTMRIEFQPGTQRMDGAHALIYARTRHADSDFDRGARQQQVLRAILSELRGRGVLGQLTLIPKLREGLAGTVATTLPFGRPDVLLPLAWLGGGLDPDGIGQVRLSPELDPDMQQDVNFNIVWSQAGIKSAVDALLTQPSVANEAAKVQVFNGTSVNGLAGKISGELENAGFVVLVAGNAPASSAAKTTIYDVGNTPRTAKRLADLLHATVQKGAPPAEIESAADVVVVLGSDAAAR